MSYNEHLTAGLANLWDCTATEAAERIVPKRKRTSYDTSREEIPWTAARCNRLLRTITSRVNILQKQSKLCAAGSIPRDAPTNPKSEQTSPGETPSPRKEPRASANDPEWVPGAKSRLQTKTYGKIRPQIKTAPPKVDSGLSTPFVKRLLKDVPLSVAKPWPKLSGSDQLLKKSRQLPVQLASSNEEAQRNLVRAFGSLLATTAPSGNSERTGARSLMSTCLRRVPDYIDLEAEDVKPDDEDADDITSSIYSELERLGTNSEGGWSGLREVVRSHSVHHVCAAVEQDLIHEKRISELVDTCSKHGALAEATSLLQAWISRHRGSSSRALDESHPALTKLSELRALHHAPELFLRHHTDLIASSSAHLNDILRAGSTLLKDLISSLVRGPGQDAALAYLEAAVTEECTSPNATCSPIFSRLAGLLASLALAQTSETPLSTSRIELSAVVIRIATIVLQQQLHEETDRASYDNSNMSRSTATNPFVMASTLLQLNSPLEDTAIASIPLVTSLFTIDTQQGTFVKFICNVVHHVFRFSDMDETESLLLITSNLLSPPSECSKDDRSALSRLAFEVAFAYREQTGIDIDHHFAEKLAASNQDMASSIAQTPRRRVQVSGYKWEEGLCEWIAATPLPKSLPAKTLPDAEDLSSHHTPMTVEEEALKQFIQKSLLPTPSSPEMTSKQSPDQTDDPITRPRPALRERSVNQQLPRNRSLPQQKKRAGQLKPPVVVPKQVHLKEERAKKAALLAAQAMPPPPKQLKRSHSLAIDAADTDELGMLTPARRKSKRVSIQGGARRSSATVRLSLPVRVVDMDGMSEDELGL